MEMLDGLIKYFKCYEVKHKTKNRIVHHNFKTKAEDLKAKLRFIIVIFFQ